MTPELSRIVDVRHLPARSHVEANDEERSALAARFAIESIARLSAEVALTGDGRSVSATGSVSADLVQQCAVSGEPFPVRITEPLALRFVPAVEAHPEELELTAEDLDDIAYQGHQFDLGEAIAQTLALAIDPYAEGPNADQARREAGLLDESAAGPFAALAALRKT